MDIYKNSWFDRFARKNKIEDKDLVIAIEQAEKGLIDADLGGSVIKQRIARKGQSKSGGYRTIILFRKNEKSFFVYGYAKSNKGNITMIEEKEFKKLAENVLSLTDIQLKDLIEAGKMIEVRLK